MGSDKSQRQKRLQYNARTYTSSTIYSAPASHTPALFWQKTIKKKQNVKQGSHRTTHRHTLQQWQYIPQFVEAFGSPPPPPRPCQLNQCSVPTICYCFPGIGSKVINYSLLCSHTRGDMLFTLLPHSSNTQGHGTRANFTRQHHRDKIITRKTFKRRKVSKSFE